MSNFLAIATVTAALEQIFLGVVPNDVTGADLTIGRPDDAPGPNSRPRVNIYLYQVHTNAAFRNADLPTRRADGTLVQRPQMALDLYYLLTFYGEENQLEPQRLLGSVVKVLHSEPLLGKERIQAATAAKPVLAASDLDRHVESIRFSPVPLNLEELSKLWSVFFQTAYSLSIAYQASVVLIESDDTPQTALPVRERTIRAIPFPQPAIDQVVAETGPSDPVTIASTIHVRGRGLRGEETKVRVADSEVTPPQISDRQISLPLSLFPADVLQAGVQGLQVVHELLLGSPLAPHRGVDSNVAPFILRPTITGVAAPDANTVTVTFQPKVGRNQRVILLLNELNLPTDRPARAARFEAPADNGIADPDILRTETISFVITGLEPGDHLVRVQVDGAESLLEEDASGRYAEPKVTIP